MEPHLTIDDVALYIGGGASIDSLLGERLATLAEHVESCESCRTEVATAVRAARTSTPGIVADDLDAAIEVGTAIGRYRVRSLHGSGAMSHVLEAEDPDLDRVVALKIVRNRDVSDDTRALREGRALARLAHPNVVAVYDVGVWAGGVFLAMELVAGTTLRDWAATPRPWREIVAMAVAAAHALDAAHQRGLVHRDVKPDNMIVGEDGRLRVIDFGLAVDHDAEHEPLGGTPAYMAPEQKSVGKGDARSDQFALFTSLYELLEGKRPGADIAFARAAPTALRSVIRRGLRARPDERFPDLGAAGRALERVLGQRRRIALGAALAAVVAIVGGSFAYAARSHDQCGASRGALAGVWDRERATAIGTTFRGFHLPYGDAVWRTTEKQLDAYADAWVAMHLDACEATHVRHEQSEDLLDARVECLRVRRDELRTLADVFATTKDPHVVERAATLTATLPALAECANREALTSPMRLPTDPVLRTRLTAVSEQITTARVLAESGHNADARAIIARIVPEARALGHLPTLALALLERGSEQNLAHDAEAEATLREAVRTAEAARLDTAKVDALVALVANVGAEFKGAADVDRARELVKDAEAALQRIGGDPDRMARLHTALATVLRLGDKLSEALAEYEHALTLDTSPIETAIDEANMANVLADLGQLDRAVASFAHARTVLESALGPEHPKVAILLSSMAAVYIDQAKPAEAKRLLERSLEIQRKLDDPGRGLTLLNLAYAYGYLGDSKNALVYFDEALAFYMKTEGEQSVYTAAVIEGRGKAQQGLGQIENAAASFQLALDIRLKLSGPTDTDVAQSHRDVGDLLLVRMTDFASARLHFTEALRIDELVLGKDNVKLVPDLNGLARAELELHHAVRAVPFLERANALLAKGDVEPQQKGRVQYQLAWALWDGGGDRVRAHKLAADAKATLSATELSDAKYDLDEVDAWIAKHP